MSKKKTHEEESPEEGAPEYGLKENPEPEVLSGEGLSPEEKVLVEVGWERCEDGQWRNLRDFHAKDGVVPQGVIRPLEEAYALEAKRVS